MVRPGMTMRDVLLRFPQSAPIFEEYGFRDSCRDCSLDVIAKKHGLRVDDIVDKVNALVLQGNG